MTTRSSSDSFYTDTLKDDSKNTDLSIDETLASPVDNADPEFLSNKQFDNVPIKAEKHERYKNSHEVGRGGMGTVYKVRDDDLKRDVAMKVLPGASKHSGALQ